MGEHDTTGRWSAPGAPTPDGGPPPNPPFAPPLAPTLPPPVTGQPPAAGYVAPGYGWTPAAPPPRRRTNGFAVASLVLGIVGCFVVSPILAIAFGIVARRQIAASGDTQDGKGMATAGIALGVVWVVLIAVVVSFGSFDFYLHSNQIGEPSVPTREEFIELATDPDHTPDLPFHDLSPEQLELTRAAFEEGASCTYDALLEEPRYLRAVYDDPNPNAGFVVVPGVRQSRIDAIDEQVIACQEGVRDRISEIVGG